MALEDHHVTATPEGVSLDLVLAGAGSRFAAYVVDLIIQVAAFYVFVYGLGSLFGGSRSIAVASTLGGVVVLFFLCDFIGYFIFFEMLMKGRSPGKALVGTRVVRAADGGPVGFWSSLLRNLLRLVDSIPFPCYLVGGVLVLATTKNQRLGDLTGNTLVIRERRAAVTTQRGQPWGEPAQWSAPAAVSAGWVPLSPYGPGQLPPELAHWDVSAVTPDELRLVQTFLSNRYGYTPEARARLAAQLANRLWPMVAGPTPDLHPEQFLEAVVLIKSVRG